MGAISMEDFVTDTNKWDTEVAPLIGGTDIILFPFGSDISDWRPYKDDNERFQYLKSKGFRYFCNVDSSQYYVQIGTDHMRQAAGIWTATGCTMICRNLILQKRI